MEAAQTKKGRGGARPNSGPKTPEGRRVTLALRIRPSIRQRLEGIAEAEGVTLSRAVEKAIETYK